MQKQSKADQVCLILYSLARSILVPEWVVVVSTTHCLVLNAVVQYSNILIINLDAKRKFENDGPLDVTRIRKDPQRLGGVKALTRKGTLYCTLYFG